MLMTKRLWKVKDKRDHPRLDRQWECFQVSREKVASDYLKKKKKWVWILCRYQEEPFDFTCITLPSRGHNSETRERDSWTCDFVLRMNIYMWVSWLSHLYRMLPKGIISLNQSRILKHGLHNWRADVCLDLRSVKISTGPMESISLLRSISKD